MLNQKQKKTMTENPLEFFDNILFTLSKDYNKMYQVEELREVLFPNKNKEISSLEFKNTVTLSNALFYLKKEDLVLVSEQGIFITTKGYIKVKIDNGFVAEYKRALWNLRIERINKIATPLIAISALVLGIINYMKT